MSLLIFFRKLAVCFVFSTMLTVIAPIAKGDPVCDPDYQANLGICLFAPIMTNISSPSSSQIILSWYPYQLPQPIPIIVVFRDGNTVGSISAGQSSSYTDSGLKANTSYRYWLCAGYNNVIGTPSFCMDQNQAVIGHTQNASSGGNNGTWHALPGAAIDISIGANGSVWILGTNHVGTHGDYQPYFWNGSNWVGIDGGLTKIAVSPDGTPKGINSQFQIFQRINNVWKQLPGAAIDISIGANGSVWILGTNHVGTHGDYQPYFWNGSNWVGIDGGLVRIAVSPDGTPKGINSQGQIFQRINNVWKRLPGGAVDISIGANGSVWVLGTNHVGIYGDYQPYFWNGSNWVGIDGGLTRIAVSPDGTPKGFNTQRQIFQRLLN